MRRRARLLQLMSAGLQDSGLEADLLEPILSEAEDGSAPAQFIVGSGLEKIGLPEEAVSWYRLSAEQGYLPAQQRLGECASLPIDHPMLAPLAGAKPRFVQ